MGGNKQDELQWRQVCCNKTWENKSLTEETIYFSGEIEDIIEGEELTSDIGMLMQNDASCTLQIEKVASKAQKKLDG